VYIFEIFTKTSMLIKYHVIS